MSAARGAAGSAPRLQLRAFMSRSARSRLEGKNVLFRHKNLFLAGLTITGVVIGCTVNVDEDRDRDRDKDGTVDVDSTRASALVLGRIDASVSGSARVFVNDEPRKILIAPDRTFVVREVPSGDCVFGFEANGLRGSVTIDAVKAGETIEVSVRVEGASIVIVITRRDASSEPPREVAETSGAPLEIRANNVCYFLRAGTYDRDIAILGNNVMLLGQGSCGASERTVLNGALTIRGNNAIVQDIELRGAVTITGNNARIQDSCSECFATACFSGSSSSGGNGGSTGGNCPPDSTGGSTTCPDSGTSGGGTIDSGTTDSGSTPPSDAGSD